MINKILIVGQGSIGIRHTEISRNFFPNADIRVLRHSDSTDIAKHANSLIVNKEEVKNFKPQIAVICNPSSFHVEIAIYLAKQGKSLIKFKESINTKNIGKILSIHCEAGQFLPDWRPNTDYRKTVSAQKALGGGVLLELSHEIDYLRWIFGEIDWVNGVLSKQSNLDIDVEDCANLTMGLQNSNTIINLKLDFYKKDSRRNCIVHGEEGSLKWNAISGSVHQLSLSKNVWEKIFEEGSLDNNQTYISEWEDFVNCIDQKKQPKVTLEDGLKVMQVIDATRKSSNSKGMRVSVNKVF